MDRWFSYFFERLNPVSTFLVITGIATSTAILDYQVFDPVNFMFSCMVWFFLIFYFRLSNDLRDVEVDKVAHPDRPVPRGVIQKKEAEVVLSGILVILVFLGVAIFLYYNHWSRLLVFITAGYFWLARHHFYLGKSLDERPLLKTLAYQGILLPMILLSLSFSHQDNLFTNKNLSYTLLLAGAFFTFEICRKLNPFCHPAVQSLIHFFGFKKVFRIAFLSLVASAVGAAGMGAANYLIPMQCVVLIALIYMFKNPRRFTIAQIAANFSLILHSWSAVFERI